MTTCLYDGNIVFLKDNVTKENLEESLYVKGATGEITSESTVRLLMNGYDPDTNAIEFPLELYDDDLMDAVKGVSEYIKPGEYLACYESMNSRNFWRLYFDGTSVKEVYPDLTGVYDMEDDSISDKTDRAPAESTPSSIGKDNIIDVYFPVKGDPERYVEQIFTSGGKIIGGMVSGGGEKYGFSVTEAGSVVLSIPPETENPRMEKHLTKTLKPFLHAQYETPKKGTKKKKKNKSR